MKRIPALTGVIFFLSSLASLRAAPSPAEIKAFCTDPARTGLVIQRAMDDKTIAESERIYVIRYLVQKYDACGALADPDMKASMDALGSRVESRIQQQELSELAARQAAEQSRHEEEMREAETKHDQELQSLKEDFEEKILEERALDDFESEQAAQRAARER